MPLFASFRLHIQYNFKNAIPTLSYKLKVKVKVLVLSHDFKLILTTLQFYPFDHWKWPHSYMFELSIFAANESAL